MSTPTDPPTSTLQGQIPSGERFHTVISEDMIVLRVDDKICVAAPKWLSLAQAERMRAALEVVRQ